MNLNDIIEKYDYIVLDTGFFIPGKGIARDVFRGEFDNLINIMSYSDQKYHNEKRNFEITYEFIRNNYVISPSGVIREILTGENYLDKKRLFLKKGGGNIKNHKHNLSKCAAGLTRYIEKGNIKKDRINEWIKKQENQMRELSKNCKKDDNIFQRFSDNLTTCMGKIDNISMLYKKSADKLNERLDELRKDCDYDECGYNMLCIYFDELFKSKRLSKKDFKDKYKSDEKTVKADQQALALGFYLSELETKKNESEKRTAILTQDYNDFCRNFNLFLYLNRDDAEMRESLKKNPVDLVVFNSGFVTEKTFSVFSNSDVKKIKKYIIEDLYIKSRLYSLLPPR
ncbi:hypothetical protein JW949_01900 [Candidatus Woesearchaeota archaeon]|nr:hypothetical protein [Candidatus Woesearchaeota archaeon]